MLHSNPMNAEHRVWVQPLAKVGQGMLFSSSESMLVLPIFQCFVTFVCTAPTEITADTKLKIPCHFLVREA